MPPASPPAPEDVLGPSSSSDGERTPDARRSPPPGTPAERRERRPPRGKSAGAPPGPRKDGKAAARKQARPGPGTTDLARLKTKLRQALERSQKIARTHHKGGAGGATGTAMRAVYAKLYQVLLPWEQCVDHIFPAAHPSRGLLRSSFEPRVPAAEMTALMDVGAPDVA